MNSWPLLILFVVVLLPVGVLLGQAKVDSLTDELTSAVTERGGEVVSSEAPFLRFGPFFFKGKGQKIIKMIYRDAQGQLHQLWGRTGVFSNDLIWDYDDGDY